MALAIKRGDPPAVPLVVPLGDSTLNRQRDLTISQNFKRSADLPPGDYYPQR